MTIDVDEVYIKFAEGLVATGNATTAAKAAGVDSEMVAQFLDSAYDHPVVVQAIMIDETTTPDFNNADDVRRHVLKNLWREAKYKGPGSQQAARIAAMKAIADLTGIEPPKKVDVGSMGRGGIMLVPLMDASVWEQNSEALQLELKAAVRD